MVGTTVALPAIDFGRLSVHAFAQATSGSAGGPIVETTAGKIRGLQQPNVHTFKGIRYGASTAGSGRFMPPSKPAPWTGILETTEFGPRAPQPLRPMIPEIGDALTGSGPMDEDCLRLNVWTPAIGRGNRAVMVWFHGGGFRTGSGHSIFYDGTALAQKHDVVVVTVTHRLNAFGFLHLPEIAGEKYTRSSNLGMQDIVLALEWVRDNIAAFGGSADNVTIFGQSGGGGKTSILQGMPAAKGLFHRAIIMSTLADTAITALEPHQATSAAELLLARLGVKPDQVDSLQKRPAEEILAALTGGTGRAGGQAGRPSPSGDISLRFTPVVDGRTLTVHPFSPAASDLAATIPILCGSNETEGVPYADPGAPYWSSEPVDAASLRVWVKGFLKIEDAEANRLIATYRKSRPSESPGDLAAVMAGDSSPLRLSSYTIAERKFAQGKAPVFMYYFQWRSPVRQGKLRSMHCMELPFVFDHVDDTQFMNGTGGDRHTLADRMSRAWVSFAKTGDPNHSGLPEWPRFDPVRRATMVFNAECRLVDDPYGEERRALARIRARASAIDTPTDRR
jgi:para-nitrobenzyl esterase